MSIKAVVFVAILGFVSVHVEGSNVATALINLGGKLIIDEQKGTKVHFWEYRGNYIIESECWEDGSGPCANGNCLDFEGRRGMKIQEISVKCAWYCVHRTHCRLQTCCPFTNSRPHTGVGNGGNGGDPSTGHHVKCRDNLLPYCTCPDGSVVTDISTAINACGRGVKPDSCVCNDGSVIDPNCVPSTYTCVDGSTCQRNLCCGSHRNTAIITCPDGSTFPPVQVGRGKK